MTKSYLIGVGGTGSKCVEAFLHLAAAGLVPNFWVGLVDQDGANGNIETTKTQIGHVIALQKALREKGEHNLASECNLLKSRVTRTDEEDGFWGLLTGNKPTLNTAFRPDSMSPNLRHLYDCLYQKNEQGLGLDQGFIGRPSIGAAAVLSRALVGEPFWRSILNAVRVAATGEAVRIFLIGSVFGGTGAAVFPTLARLIRKQISASQTTNVKLGGALMLPYFQFAAPAPNTAGARSEAFLEQTRAALNYYHDLVASYPTNKPLFDNIYLAGWSPLIELSYFSSGGREQANPPLLPELYPALAARKFFSEASLPPQRVFYTGRKEHDEDQFNWEDLPEIDGVGGKPGVKDKLGQLLRFAIAYKWQYRPHLHLKKWRQIAGERWFRRLVGSSVNLDDDDVQKVLRRMDDYTNRLLQWICDMTYAKGDLDIRLFDAPAISKFSRDPKRPADLLKTLGREHKVRIKDINFAAKGPTLAEIYWRLTYDEPSANGNKGIGRLFGAIFEACRPN